VFESIPESVAAQAATCVALLGSGEQSGELPAHVGSRPEGDVLLRLAHVPTGLPAALGALPVGARVVSSACTGVTYAAIAGDGADDALAQVRAALLSHDGTAVVLRDPSGRLDHWGPVGSSLELMRRVKHRFDPDGRMSPGRFVGGL